MVFSRWGTCEVDGTKYLAFVNNKEDEHSKLCSNYPAVAFGFFKKILDEVSTDTGAWKCEIICTNYCTIFTVLIVLIILLGTF